MWIVQRRTAVVVNEHLLHLHVHRAIQAINSRWLRCGSEIDTTTHAQAHTHRHTHTGKKYYVHKNKTEWPSEHFVVLSKSEKQKNRMERKQVEKDEQKKKRMVRKCKVKRKELNEKTAMAKEPRDSKGKCWIPFFSFYLNVNVCAFTGPHSDVEYTHVLTTTYYTWIFLSCFPFTFSLLTKLLQYFSHSSINYYNRNKRIFWTLTYNFACRTP